MSDALVNGLAGACGGILAQLVTYPLQAVNTRQQTQRRLLAREQRDGEHGAGECAASGAEGAASGKGAARAGQRRAPRPKSTQQEMWEIFQREGVAGLYRGLEPSLVGTACSQGVYYFVYQLFRSHVEQLAAVRKAQGVGNGQVTMITSLLVAALAGSVNVLLTNPIWVIVTRMQTQTQGLPPPIYIARRTPSSSPPNSTPPTYAAAAAGTTGTAGEGKQAEAQRSEGVGGAGGKLDGGSTAAGEGRGAGGVVAGVGSGTCAGSGEGPLQAPGDGRQQLIGRPHGVLETIWELFEEAGILGFWKGVFPTLLMVANPAIQFMIYETLLARITAARPAARGGAKSATSTEIFLVGALAKIGATLATYPMLVVKSRLQARHTAGQRYSGMLDAIFKIVRQEGMLGFYHGMGTKMAQSVFAASLLFLTKEEIVKAVRLLLDRRARLLLHPAHRRTTAL
ncbi:hypothetical protein CLOP_g14170 [Closterium sp. NIES-67]|nr:hypothetical protein CLOP_g14170 [Closterium sp. NIES-67]